MFNQIHHVAIIATDYKKSRNFYVDILKLPIICETYRENRNSCNKLDLAVGNAQIELFSFPNPPPRPSRPEAAGLRHLAFKVDNLDECVSYLVSHNIEVEDIRVDSLTNKRFTFFADPDDLPLEIYEN